MCLMTEKPILQRYVFLKNTLIIVSWLTIILLLFPSLPSSVTFCLFGACKHQTGDRHRQQCFTINILVTMGQMTTWEGKGVTDKHHSALKYPQLNGQSQLIVLVQSCAAFWFILSNENIRVPQWKLYATSRLTYLVTGDHSGAFSSSKDTNRCYLQNINRVSVEIRFIS